MNIKDLSYYNTFFSKVSKSVREVTLNIQNKTNLAELKIDKSPVTKFDLKIESLIRTAISSEFPSHNIIGEEFDDIKKGSDYTWIIDPIDGTKSFIVGRPLWASMIALLFKEKPIVSMVDFPKLDQLWIAYKDKLILNGDNFNYKEKNEKEFTNLIFASTAPELFEINNLSKINKLIKNLKFNLWSGDCHNYLLLMQGKVDLIIEENLKCWDILPIIPIINSKRLLIRDWQGKEIFFSGNKNEKFRVIATNQVKILEKVIEFLN